MLSMNRVQHRLFIILTAIIVLLTGTIIYREYDHTKSRSILAKGAPWREDDLFINNNPNNDVIDAKVQSMIKIYIAGHVEKPGVISIIEGARLSEAIAIAGGALPEADLNRVNLAVRLKDEEMYYIPSVGEEIPVSTGISTQIQDVVGMDQRVNINTADQKQLEVLQGIGPARALSIITYRDKNGPFGSIEELMNISGIGDKIFVGIKDQIVVK